MNLFDNFNRIELRVENNFLVVELIARNNFGEESSLGNASVRLEYLGDAIAEARNKLNGLLRGRIAELETALRGAIAIIRADDHPTRQGMADQFEKTLNI